MEEVQKHLCENCPLTSVVHRLVKEPKFILCLEADKHFFAELDETAKQFLPSLTCEVLNKTILKFGSRPTDLLTSTTRKFAKWHMRGDAWF